jgi:hypothetical protein
MKFAIVVIAYNRPDALSRLLRSLDAAQTRAPSTEIPLVISIDQSDNALVTEIAEGYHWKLGQKRVVKHKERQGLKKHILSAGDLVDDFENVVMLEDDLWVSPFLWEYIAQSIGFCELYENIAQVSLYSNVYNETACLPFQPFNDGHDNYYMKVASSWGQLWTRNQWREFKKWLPRFEDKRNKYEAILPANAKRWPETSWKKIFQSYLIDQNKLVLYPRVSLTTNFSDAGTHHVGGDFHLQSPILTFEKPLYNLAPPLESHSVYDEHCERADSYFIDDMLQAFNLPEILVDLYGTKDPGKFAGKYVLTSQEVTGDVLAIFSPGLRPHELNIKGGERPGSGFYKLIKFSDKPVGNALAPIASTKPDKFLYYYAIPERIFKSEARKKFPKPKAVTRKQAIKVLLPNWLIDLIKRAKRLSRA